jgi:hypothetical protein
MEFELNALDKICVWEVTQAPANMKIVGSKWVYYYKYNPSGHIIKEELIWPLKDSPKYLG